MNKIIGNLKPNLVLVNVRQFALFWHTQKNTELFGPEDAEGFDYIIIRTYVCLVSTKNRSSCERINCYCVNLMYLLLIRSKDTLIFFYHQMQLTSFIILCYEPKNAHNNFTNCHTATCFDTIVSSSDSLQSIPCPVTPVHTGQHDSNINIQTVYTATTTD